MSGIQYLAPSSISEAVKALGDAKGAGRILAGGTDLIVQMRGGRARPGVIIDIKRLPAITEIRTERGAFVIGAATPGAVIGEHQALRKAWPGVVEAANLIGSTQVQGRASLGGNLCNASPAADSVPALIAAGAICVVETAGGPYRIEVEKFTTGPGKTILVEDEILVAFELPPRPSRSGDAYLRLIPRTEMDIAVVGCGVNLAFDEAGVCTAARIGIGAVAPTALLVEEAGAALVGTRLEPAAVAKMEAAVAATCKPISDKRGTAEYRTRIACVLARRAAAIAKERASA